MTWYPRIRLTISLAAMLGLAPGCIINIHAGLTNRTGQPVTAIQIICDDYAGEPKWTLPDLNDVKHFNVRVMCDN